MGSNWRFENGCLRVSDALGLGVELDEGKLAEMAAAAAHCGLTKRDDVSFMRRIVPDWQPMNPRW